jgi:hypothetical protein
MNYKNNIWYINLLGVKNKVKYVSSIWVMHTNDKDRSSIGYIYEFNMSKDMCYQY